jgi:4-amino-4-deoxy-L-arabinose transferase-like glycosyltransferase
MENEARVGAYVVDVLQNGHWMAQHDISGDVMSKPPLLTWLAALATWPFGQLNRFSLYLPSALAAIFIGLALLRFGRTHFGWRAGFLAALMYLISPMADSQILTARYDSLFTLPVALGAMAAFRAWTSGRGWTWFWFSVAAATMIKGPLGLILAAGGLLAAWWEKRSGTPLPLRGSHWLGLALYLLICGGWLWLAYRELGSALTDKMLGRELVAHAVGGPGHPLPLQGFYEPTLNFLIHFAPWSLVAGAAFWQVWRHPAAEANERRLERFLFCWFFVGLILFSLGAHQRGRLIIPILPAAALLAGRQLSQWLSLWSVQKFNRFAWGVVSVFLLVVGLRHHVFLRWSSRVQETVGMKQLATDIRQRWGEQLNYVDTPFALQFYLNTARRNISHERAAELLTSNSPVAVAVSDLTQVRAHLPADVQLFELARWPTNRQAVVRIVSNTPQLTTNGPSARTVAAPELREKSSVASTEPETPK